MGGMTVAGRRLGILVPVLLVVAGCSWTGPLVHWPVPRRPTSTALASPSPTATVPTGLRSTFTAEQDGIRATVRFDRMPLIAGEVNWATTRLTNIGTDDVEWFHDGCSITIEGHGTMDQTLPMGVEQSGNLGAFKDSALEYAPDGQIRLALVPREFVEQGTYTCDLIGLTDVIRPGGSIRQWVGWNGQVNRLLGIPPNGAVTFTLHFEYYWRPGLPRRPGGVLELPASGWVSGGVAPDRLAAPQIVDAALEDPGFRAWAEGLHIGNGDEPICWYRLAVDVWWVGAVLYRNVNDESVRPASLRDRGPRHWHRPRGG